MPSRDHDRRQRPEDSIPLIYAAASAAWIVLTDVLLGAGVGGASWLSAAKGLAFVAATALLLRLLLLRVRRREAEVEERYRLLFDAAPDGILVFQDGRYVAANPAAARLLGAASPAALEGASPGALVAPPEVGAALERLERALRGDDAGPPAIRTMLRADGSEARLEVGVARLRYRGRPAVQVVLREHGEAWRLQQEAARLNRALGTLSAVNEAVARAQGEQELLDQVCRIGVEQGGFRMVMVVRARRDEPRTLSVVASHGVGGAEVDALQATWEAREYGLGTAGGAVREGRPAVHNDVQAEHPFPPAREVATRLGFRAIASFPLAGAWEVPGVLTFAAAEPGTFDPQLVELLGRLSDDLAVGIGALRARALLQGILDHAPMLAFAVDLEGRWTMVNRAWERTTGRRREEVLGRHLSTTFAPEAAAEILANNQLVISSGQLHQRVQVMALAAGVRDLEVYKFPVRDAAGRITQVAGLGIDVTDRRRAEAELRASREELRTLAGRLMGAREEEATRIARDLHDDLGQLLTALRIELGRLEERAGRLAPGPEAAGVVELAVSAAELADRTTRGVHRVVANLRPAGLELLGLEGALREEARRLEERTGIRCELRVAEAQSLGKEQALGLYRIAQEALTNVARHSGARRVSIDIARADGRVELTVEDDGRGPPGGGVRPGAAGLVGMRERAALLGGEVSVGRAPSGGTRVRASLPAVASA